MIYQNLMRQEQNDRAKEEKSTNITLYGSKSIYISIKKIIDLSTRINELTGFSYIFNRSINKIKIYY